MYYIVLTQHNLKFTLLIMFKKAVQSARLIHGARSLTVTQLQSVLVMRNKKVCTDLTMAVSSSASLVSAVSRISHVSWYLSFKWSHAIFTL